MSTVVTKNVQVGTSGTAAQNFTVYQPVTPDGTVRIGNGNSGSVTDLVTLNSSGNLGIGTSSPSEKLTVNGNIKLGTSGTAFLYGPSTTGRSVLSNSDSTAYVTLYGSSYGSSLDSVISFVAGTSNVMTFNSSGNLGLGVTPSAWATFKAMQVGPNAAAAFVAGNGADSWFGDSAYYNAGWKYAASGVAVSAMQQASGAFKFYTAPSGTAGNAITFTQAMTLDASGNLLVGTIDTSMGGLKGLRVGSGSATGAALVIAGVGAANKGFFYSSSAGVTWETVSGALAQVVSGGTGGVSLANGATSWSAISDERLKTVLTPFENAAEKVCSLRTGTGRYLTDDETVSRSFLIAQDVQVILPEAVDVQNDEQNTLALRYTDTIPLLVAAIQEQQALITQLQADVAALKAAA